MLHDEIDVSSTNHSVLQKLRRPSLSSFPCKLWPKDTGRVNFFFTFKVCLFDGLPNIQKQSETRQTQLHIDAN